MVPRVVLVPGLGLDDRSSAALRARRPAEVVLLPGMGLAEDVPTVDELAARLLAGLGEGPVVLVGHSQSCQVVAAAAPDPRVVGLVLIGPTTEPRLRSAGGLARQWLRTAAHEPPRVVPLVVGQWRSTGPRAMRALWRQAAPDRIEHRLPLLDRPVVVVRGTRDRLCSRDWAAALATRARHGRLVEIPDGGHLVVTTHPGEVADILDGVAAGVPPGA